MVRLIDGSERFLYIENQYFVGSSEHWAHPSKTAPNPVPLAIARKIAAKIHSGEQYCAYVTLPLLPEFNLEKKNGHIGKTIIGLLFETISMMYAHVGAALREAHSDALPTDYLVFLCLGKQEARPGKDPLGAPRPGSTEDLWRQRSRFLIYVHSKVMIGDDELMITGTANINERSLSAGGDSEIAIAFHERIMGALGPEQCVSDGKVAQSRSSLWAEHTGGLSQEEEALKDPGSLKAIRRICQLADEASEAFRTKGGQPHGVRFLRYPIQVTPEGKVVPDPHFPDFEDIPVEGRIHPLFKVACS